MHLPLIVPSTALLMVLVLGGCGPSPSNTGESWPKRVTLKASHSQVMPFGLRLSDGTVHLDSADLDLRSARGLSLTSPAGNLICEKGIYGSLDDIPTTTGACPKSFTGQWSPHAELSIASVHESHASSAAGLGLLVRDAETAALYRLRVVGDSYDAQGRSTVTFDYAPAP